MDTKFNDAFDEIINFVSVVFRKKYGNGGEEDVTSQIMINGDDLKRVLLLKVLLIQDLALRIVIG